MQDLRLEQYVEASERGASAESKSNQCDIFEILLERHSASIDAFQVRPKLDL